MEKLQPLTSHDDTFWVLSANSQLLLSPYDTQGRIKLLVGPMPKTFGGPFSLMVIGNRAIR